MSALLEVSGVSVTFDGFRAINNLSFAIGAAELRAVIGPNGAGKTTFMDIVTGKTRPDEGSVTFGEVPRSLLKLSEAQIARAGVGRKFQRPTVFEDQTVACPTWGRITGTGICTTPGRGRTGWALNLSSR